MLNCVQGSLSIFVSFSATLNNLSICFFFYSVHILYQTYSLTFFVVFNLPDLVFKNLLLLFWNQKFPFKEFYLLFKILNLLNLFYFILWYFKQSFHVSCLHFFNDFCRIKAQILFNLRHFIQIGFCNHVLVFGDLIFKKGKKVLHFWLLLHYLGNITLIKWAIVAQISQSINHLLIKVCHFYYVLINKLRNFQ